MSARFSTTSISSGSTSSWISEMSEYRECLDVGGLNDCGKLVHTRGHVLDRDAIALEDDGHDA